MKKKFLFLLWLCALIMLSACSDPKTEARVQVIAESFPEYDWTRQILGDIPGVSLELLIDDGTEKHSFQPNVKDVISVLNCDLLICGGGESDAWLADVLAENSFDIKRVLNLFTVLDDRLLTVQYREGMQIRETEEEEDEHFWLSLRNAQICCDAITEKLVWILPQYETKLRENNRMYQEKLRDLDMVYTSIIAGAENHVLLICDRFPLRYLVEDYSLDYYAAFPGCSSETGASFSTIIFLTERLIEHELSAILILEGNDQKVAQIVARSSGIPNVKLLEFNSMQTVPENCVNELDYLQIMAENASVLQQALQ